MRIRIARSLRRIENQPGAVQLCIQRRRIRDIAFVISAHRCRAVRGRVLHQTGRIQPQRARIIEEHADSSVLLVVKIRVGRVAECTEQILQSGAALCGKQVDLRRFQHRKRQRLAVKQQRFRIDRIRISRKAA